ncbi:hypothetical protein BS78_03G123500 [Paspalum vaginatum]|nr:hypothetical protein BS78_03G123500 [Paspalum vaginatum]
MHLFDRSLRPTAAARQTTRGKGRVIAGRAAVPQLLPRAVRRPLGLGLGAWRRGTKQTKQRVPESESEADKELPVCHCIAGSGCRPVTPARGGHYWRGRS